MADPTWTDELLQRWWEGCSEETKDWIAAPVSIESPATFLVGLAVSNALNEIPACLATDAARLRDLIDAELRAGREAKQLLAHESIQHAECSAAYEPYCAICGYDAPDHGPDCDLARLMLTEEQPPQPSAAPQTPPKT